MYPARFARIVLKWDFSSIFKHCANFKLFTGYQIRRSSRGFLSFTVFRPKIIRKSLSFLAPNNFNQFNFSAKKVMRKYHYVVMKNSTWLIFSVKLKSYKNRVIYKFNYCNTIAIIRKFGYFNYNLIINCAKVKKHEFWNPETNLQNFVL